MSSDEFTLLADDLERYLFTHRCEIQRDDNVLEDAYGHPKAMHWVTHLVDQTCHYWTRRERERNATDLAMAAVTNSFLLLPYGTDVRLTDRVAAVRDVYGTEIAGPFNIRAIMHRRAYLQLALEALKST